MPTPIRGYPPVGMYIGKVKDVKVSTRESRSGKPYEAAQVLVSVTGGSEGISVNSDFDIGNVTFRDLDKIRAIPPNKPFFFEVVQNGSYPGFGFIGTKQTLEDLLKQVKEAEA